MRGKPIYSTEHSWGDKKNTYRYRYDDEGDRIVKYREHSYKFFNGEENVHMSDDTEVESWLKNDDSMPDWLRDKF